MPAQVGCSHSTATAVGFCILTFVTSSGVVMSDVRTAPLHAASACSTRRSLGGGGLAVSGSTDEDDAGMPTDSRAGAPAGVLALMVKRVLVPSLLDATRATAGGDTAPALHGNVVLMYTYLFRNSYHTRM